MAFEFKNKEKLVNDVISNIKSNISFDIDTKEGEPLRTIVEAIMQELDFQYWQIKQTYENSFIDTAYGEELSKLVKILGIERRAAVKANGSVTFFRETAAITDYLIPVGTLVETLPDSEGRTIRYETTENVTLEAGQLEVNANVIAVQAGEIGNVTANKIIVINNPPLGIESVKNIAGTINGEDEETDAQLRERATKTLETKGNGTINAIYYKLINTPGINSVSIIDVARGIGTVDILILGDTLPMPQSKMDEVLQIIQETKAGGIDILVEEPTTKTQNVSITLTLAQGVLLADVDLKAREAIENYFKSLSIGETLYKNQLAKEVLNSSEFILDLNITTPSANVTSTNKELIVLGTITLG